MKYISLDFAFILLISIIMVTRENDIELSLIEGPENTYQSQLCIGKPIQCLNVYVDFSHPFIWVNDVSSNIPSEDKFDLTKAKINSNMKPMLINKRNLQIQGFYLQDNIVLSQCTLTQVNIAVAVKGKKIKSKIAGGLGLGYPLQTINKSPKSFIPLSFIQELKNQGFINQMIFVFETISKNKRRILFGKVPDVIVSNNKHFGRCKLILRNNDSFRKKRNNWSCFASSIDIGINTNVFDGFTTQSIDFNIQQPNFIVPRSFFHMLKNNYFKDLIDKGECSIVKDKKYSTFVCLHSIPAFPTIYLNFGNWKIALESKDLFYPQGSNMTFYIRAKFKKNNYNWVLGEAVLKHFIVVFDVENSLIGLYNNKLVSYNDDKEDIEVPNYPTTSSFRNQVLKFVCCILLLIYFILGILLFYRWIRRWIKRHEKKEKSSLEDNLVQSDVKFSPTEEKYNKIDGEQPDSKQDNDKVNENANEEQLISKQGNQIENKANTQEPETKTQ